MNDDNVVTVAAVRVRGFYPECVQAYPDRGFVSYILQPQGFNRPHAQMQVYDHRPAVVATASKFVPNKDRRAENPTMDALKGAINQLAMVTIKKGIRNSHDETWLDLRSIGTYKPEAMLYHTNLIKWHGESYGWVVDDPVWRWIGFGSSNEMVGEIETTNLVTLTNAKKRIVIYRFGDKVDDNFAQLRLENHVFELPCTSEEFSAWVDADPIDPGY